MSQVASNYGQALFDLVKEEQLDTQVLQELSALQEAFAREPDFITLLSAPNLAKQERCDILEKSFRDQVHIYVLNFMKILTEKGYMRHFAECYKVYRQLYNELHGILPVQAVTAVPLQQSQMDKLTKKLNHITGKKVELSCRVDPSVLGGVRLDYDGKQVDGTVQGRLDSVRDLLKNTVL